jgi:hypothetical protein
MLIIQFTNAIAIRSDSWQGRIIAFYVTFTSTEIRVEDGLGGIRARIFIFVTVAGTCFRVKDWVHVVPASIFLFNAVTGAFFRVKMR